MTEIINAISSALLLIGSIACFVILLSLVIPHFVLKVGTDLGVGLGRGYKKFVYPTGRAVAYEPHPSVRKYVTKYFLFVNEGYKYLKFSIDKGVQSLKYTVIMINNKDRVIDTLEVIDDVGYAAEAGEVLLHPDTSYVAFSIDEINGTKIRPQCRGYYSLVRLGIYFAAVAVVSFLELLLASFCVESFMASAFSVDIPMVGMAGSYALWALLVAAVSLLFLLIHCRRKGIRVVAYGK